MNCLNTLKKHLRTLPLFAGALALSAVLAFSGSSQAQAAENLPASYPVSEPVLVWGTAQHEGDRLVLTNVQGDTVHQEIVLNISDETKILEASGGYPVALDSIRDGETIYAYISQAMTMSLPPQSHAELILCQIPQGAAVPSYEKVDFTAFLSSDVQAVTPAVGQIATLPGTTWAVMDETVSLPYLTRNIVTAQDLTPGTAFLVWPAGTAADGLQVAGKIVIFQ